MDYKTIFRWEAAGFVLIVIIGSLLHFCFEWSGRSVPLALFCAVNESVWEHLKLGFWPCLFFAFVEYLIWGKGQRNFLLAKTLSLYTIAILIVSLYYFYTSITGSHNLITDISIFILSIAVAQYISFRVLTCEKELFCLNKTAPVLLLVIILAFSLFTYCPPKLELFMDPRTGSFGIP